MSETIPPKQLKAQTSVKDEKENEHDEEQEGEWEDADDDDDDDDDDDEWESDGEGEPLTKERMKEILELAEQHNNLFKALMSHPKMDKKDPSKAPKPLFFVADFVRRTYLEYLLPMMPWDAAIRSTRFANEYLLGYTEAVPYPTDAADEYLNDQANWSNDSSTSSLFMDAVGRTMMISLCITDDFKGHLMTQGRFDWVDPIDIKALARQMAKA